MITPRPQVPVSFLPDHEGDDAARVSARWRVHPAVGGILLMGIVLISYFSSARFDFILTDRSLIRQNVNLRSGIEGLRAIWFAPGAVPHYAPLAYSVMLVENTLFRGRAGAFHAVSVLTHMINVLLLWFLLRSLHFKGSLFAAAVFAVHPLQMEAVAWVSQQRILFASTLYLLGLWSFVRSGNVVAATVDPGRLSWQVPRWAWLILASLFGAAAMLCHPFALTFPLCAAALEWGMRRRIDRGRLACHVALLGLCLLIVAIMITAHLRSVRADGSIAAWENLGSSLQNLGSYAAGVIVPVGLPSLAAEQGPGGFFSAHSMYLLFGGIAAAITAGLIRLLARTGVKPVVTGAAGMCIVLVLMAVTMLRLPVFRNDQTLWTDVIQRDPDSIAALNAIGLIELRDRKSPQAAIGRFIRALAIDPDDTRSLLNLGRAYLATRDFDLAINQFGRLLATDPNHAEAKMGLAVAYARQGRSAEALTVLQGVIADHPEHARAHLELGALYTDRGDYENAMRCYDNAVRLDPRNPAIYVEAARMLFSGFGDWKTSEALLQRARSLDPSNVEAIMLAGGIQFELAKQKAQSGAPRGETREAFWTAEMFFREAIRLRPDVPLAHVNLGKCLGARSMYAHTVQEAIECLNDAIFCFDRAENLDPDDPEPRQLRAKAQQDRAEASRKIR